jgi:hypothetical protein
MSEDQLRRYPQAVAYIIDPEKARSAMIEFDIPKRTGGGCRMLLSGGVGGISVHMPRDGARRFLEEALKVLDRTERKK